MPKRKKSGSTYTSKGERRNVNKSILKAVFISILSFPLP